jgi:hypothetical protein
MAERMRSDAGSEAEAVGAVVVEATKISGSQARHDGKLRPADG